ncbi:MAG TPA: geranylgeranyl reductase family protein [Parafilimonas sp.]|nr:geranylgeranyl reductase family protein [Parafilimonas sp.]
MIETIDTKLCIVGAGPAGSTTSVMLCKMNIPHVIVDAAEFPRDKICGDGLDLKVVRVLNNIDPLIVRDEFSKTDFTQSFGMRFILPKGKQIDLMCSNKNNEALFNQPIFYTSRRTSFDEYLFSKIDRKMADVKTKCIIQKIYKENNYWVLEGKHASSPIKIKTQMLVGADGDHSVVLKHVGERSVNRYHYAAALRQYWKNVDGIHEKKLIEIYFPKKYPFAYFWIFPLQNNEVNAGFGMASYHVAKKNLNIRDALKDIIQNDAYIAHRFKKAEALEQPKGWGIPMSTLNRKAHGDGWLLTGDAASLVAPNSGEGIGPAMLSAYIAAHYIQRAVEKNCFTENMFSNYDKEVHKRLQSEERLYRLANAMSPSLFVHGVNAIMSSKFFKKWYTEKEMKRWLVTAYEKPIDIHF